MGASVTATTAGPDARAEALVASYERAGYARVAPALLQTAEPFLDLSGEDIRKRMYLTTAPDGSEFCLRPDLTIPVSRDYLASPAAGRPAGFCYLGPVFRHRVDGAAEFLQAGIESFGRPDKAAADAEMLSLGLEATAGYGLGQPDIRTGDVALFAGLIAGLELPAAWKRRLIKDFNRKTNLAQDLDRLALGGNNARPEYQGVLAALAGSDPKGAHALVTDLHAVNSTLVDNGFGPQLLCTLVAFRDDQERRLALIYLYKRGTFYPFAPLSGEHRDNALELQVKGVIGTDLKFEPDLARWFPVWGAPGL